MAVGVAVQSDGAGERISDTVTREVERLLRHALERHDRQMPAPAETTDVAIWSDTWLPADESVGGRARRPTWPSRSGFEARRPAGGTEAMIRRLSAC